MRSPSLVENVCPLVSSFCRWPSMRWPKTSWKKTAAARPSRIAGPAHGIDHRCFVQRVQVLVDLGDHGVDFGGIGQTVRIREENRCSTRDSGMPSLARMPTDTIRRELVHERWTWLPSELTK